jgi:hypothetical protein
VEVDIGPTGAVFGSVSDMCAASSTNFPQTRSRHFVESL